MRHCFRYYNGYINIDEENLYLTTTGNWSEAGKLSQKKLSPTELKRTRNNIIISAMVIFLLGAFYNYYNDGYSGVFIVLLIVLAPS